VSGAAARARPSPAYPAYAAFDAAGNRVVWVRGAAVPRDAAAARALLGASPDPHAEILAVLGPEAPRPRAWFYNPDGSPERLCGNALRCLAAFVGADRGRRVLAWTALGAAASWLDAHGLAWAAIPRAPLAVSEHAGFHLVDVGTPHRVACVADVTAPEVSALGRQLSAGADGVNATFFTPEGRAALRVRTLERGVLTETGSCGTGAIAAYLTARAAAPRAHADRVTARFPSGESLVVRALGWGRWLAVGGRARRIP